MTVKYRFLIDYDDIMDRFLIDHDDNMAGSEINLNVTPFRYLEKGKVTEYFPIDITIGVKTGEIKMRGCLAVRRKYDRNYDWIFQDNKKNPLPYKDVVVMAKQMITAVEDWLFTEWAKSRDYYPIDELIRTLKSQDLS